MALSKTALIVRVFISREEFLGSEDPASKLRARIRSSGAVANKLLVTLPARLRRLRSLACAEDPTDANKHALKLIDRRHRYARTTKRPVNDGAKIVNRD